MAKTSGSKNSASSYSKAENEKLGDIITAAKSTMGGVDYSEGYPAPKGALRNSYKGKK